MGAITIHGRLTRDPELRFTPGGTPVASLGIAENERKKDQHGNWTDGDTTFYSAVAWGVMAEAVAEDLSRGDAVVATGAMKTRKYTDKQGEEKTVWEVTLDDIGPSLKWKKPGAPKSTQAQPAYDDEPPFLWRNKKCRNWNTRPWDSSGSSGTPSGR